MFTSVYDRLICTAWDRSTPVSTPEETTNEKRSRFGSNLHISLEQLMTIEQMYTEYTKPLWCNLLKSTRRSPVPGTMTGRRTAPRADPRLWRDRSPNPQTDRMDRITQAQAPRPSLCDATSLSPLPGMRYPSSHLLVVVHKQISHSESQADLSF